uniref:Uncharacterized protein n=1 Tax=Anguilla anguilla TaxID=7936 RepID=A0A0E9W982_ANGAN
MITMTPYQITIFDTPLKLKQSSNRCS